MSFDAPTLGEFEDNAPAPLSREELHQKLTEQYRNRDWCLREIERTNRILLSDLGEDHKGPARTYQAQIKERLADVQEQIEELESQLPEPKSLN